MKNGIVKHFIQKNKRINSIIIKYKEKEKHVSFGEENPNITFFVIRRNAPDAGLFSFVVTNIGWMKYAIDKGYVPVIDMQYYYNTYITEEDVGRVNSWEYYFKQPCGYSLEDIKKSKKVIISSISATEHNPNLMDNEICDWRFFSNEYLFFSNAVKCEIDKTEKELFCGDRVLGVLCRGTDYMAIRPHGHPVQPEPVDVIKKAKELLICNNCHKIFLATEDMNIYEQFIDAFGSIILSSSSQRYLNTGKNTLNDISAQNESIALNPGKDKYKKGFDYAVTIGLLSRCNGLLAGKTSGTIGAVLLSKGYEFSYFFELGKYK